MYSVNILKSAIKSSQGDLNTTLQAIKNTNIKVSSKLVATLDDIVSVPYFLFENEVKDDFDEIQHSIKKIALELVENLDTNQKMQTALIIGTSQIDLNIIEIIEILHSNEINNFQENKKRSIDSYAKDISNELGLNGYTMTISTACTSSANAILEAKNLIQNGIFKNVIVIGVEIFSSMMCSGFSSMKLLSESSQKPFDKNRNGLVLGEAIAGVLLSSEKSAWSIKGGYSNCDSVTITSVSESGNEFTEVMSNALISSKVKPHEITAIKTHATSSLSNDLSEINAMSSLFSNEILFTALKPYIGHTLGACGVLELAILTTCIDDGFLPKTINHHEPIHKKYIALKEHTSCSYGLFMLNYFGFGGNNTSMIIQKEET